MNQSELDIFPAGCKCQILKVLCRPQLKLRSKCTQRNEKKAYRGEYRLSDPRRHEFFICRVIFVCALVNGKTLDGWFCCVVNGLRCRVQKTQNLLK